MKIVDPSDLYWGSLHMDRLETEPDWPASTPQLEQIVHRSGVKFEYSAWAPPSAQPLLRDMLSELGYNRVPLRISDPSDLDRFEEKDVFRYGPKERFVQLTMYYRSP